MPVAAAGNCCFFVVCSDQAGRRSERYVLFKEGTIVLTIDASQTDVTRSRLLCCDSGLDFMRSDKRQPLLKLSDCMLLQPRGLHSVHLASTCIKQRARNGNDRNEGNSEHQVLYPESSTKHQSVHEVPGTNAGSGNPRD